MVPGADMINIPSRMSAAIILILTMWKGGIILKTKAWLLFLGVFLMTSISTMDAQARKWGVGTFLSWNNPVGKLGDQFGPAPKYGASWQYLISPRLYLEVEYHYSKWKRGKLVDRTFTWSVDGQDYLSPRAEATMKMNSMMFNLLIFHQELPSFKGKDFTYYFTVGGGFHDYKAARRNFIYPEQKAEPIDKTLVLQDQIDTRAALTGNIGFGVQAFAIDNVAIDIRARYHVMMGDIRPMWDWGIPNKAFPMMLFDIGAGAKFYFWK